jgi:hypothetical protein
MTLVRSEVITYGVRDVLADTKAVKLVSPVNGMTTQEDANIHFSERLDALEAGGGGGPITEIDGGDY